MRSRSWSLRAPDSNGGHWITKNPNDVVKLNESTGMTSGEVSTGSDSAYIVVAAESANLEITITVIDNVTKISIWTQRYPRTR